jgi:hypothetical protein
MVLKPGTLQSVMKVILKNCLKDNLWIKKRKECMKETI